MINAFRIGQSVTYMDSSANNYGERGTVVEINEAGRVRVKWSDKRTWIRPTALIASDRISDEEITSLVAARDHRYMYGKPAAPKIAKPAPKHTPEIELLRPEQQPYMVDRDTTNDAYASWYVKDNSTGEIVLKDCNLHWAIIAATRLSKSKRPEAMLRRIKETGNSDA